MDLKTIVKGGKRYVLVPEADYRRLAEAEAKMPALPPEDAQGNRPAVEFARATIARNIIRDREALGLSQAELARQAEIRVETLNRIENAKVSPDTATLAKIDEALKTAGGVLTQVQLKHKGEPLNRRFDRIPFKLPNGSRGTAVVLIFDLPSGTNVVVCADEDPDADVAVNMAIERLAPAVIRRNGLEPRRLVWLEYTPYTVKVHRGTIGGWERVAFEELTPERAKGPSWHQIKDLETWRKLHIDPPTQPKAT